MTYTDEIKRLEFAPAPKAIPESFELAIAASAPVRRVAAADAFAGTSALADLKLAVLASLVTFAMAVGVFMI